MSTVRVTPRPVRGTVFAPPSKSYTHRALVVGHLAGHAYRVVGPLDSADTRATARGITALGTRVRYRRGNWTVGARGEKLSRRTVTIDCGESGTTLRFLVAVAALDGRRVLLTGRGRLLERPMEGLLAALRKLGADCRIRPETSAVEIEGPLHSGRVSLDASESSQFASALLLTLPTVEGESIVRLVGPIVSAPYLEATESVLRFHGVRVVREGRSYRIPGGQRFRGTRFLVPGDASSAAYLWAAAAISDGEVQVHGIPRAWPQADRAILPLLRQAGANVTPLSDGARVTGPVRRPFRVDLTDAPDLYPLAGVLAARITGPSHLAGAAHVVGKESDRKAGTARLVRALGARVRSGRNALVIQGTGTPRPFVVRDLADHRMVMSAAVGALAASGPSLIGEARSVDKSFPEFWKFFERLAPGATRP